MKSLIRNYLYPKSRFHSILLTTILSVAVFGLFEFLTTIREIRFPVRSIELADKEHYSAFDLTINVTENSLGRPILIVSQNFRYGYTLGLGITLGIIAGALNTRSTDYGMPDDTNPKPNKAEMATPRKPSD